MKLLSASIRHYIITVLTTTKRVLCDWFVKNTFVLVCADGVMCEKDGEEKDGCCGGGCHSEEKGSNC